MIVSSPKEMAKFAQVAASLIAKLGPGPEKATIIALVGDLGAGKTSFTQSFLKELGIKEKVVSPTFVIMRSFRLPRRQAGMSSKKKNAFKVAHHIDAYRVSATELNSLGLKEMLKNPQNLIVIEWADRIKRSLPKGTIWIEIEHGKNEKHRTIKIS